MEHERADWALDARRVELAVSGEPSVPRDLLPADSPARLPSALSDHLGRGGESTHVVPTPWRLQDGTGLAINVGEEPRAIAGEEVPPRTAMHLP